MYIIAQAILRLYDTAVSFHCTLCVVHTLSSLW
eukprot:COSAG01_NODE_55513_length_324_cov_1.346667_1_plen_32_part_10